MPDETYTLPEQPVYHALVRKLQNTDEANADTVLNPLIQAILENIQYALAEADSKADADHTHEQYVTSDNASALLGSSLSPSDIGAASDSDLTAHTGSAALHLRQLTCTKSGTVFQLTGLSGASGLVSCTFKAPTDFSDTNTFTVDGTAYAIQLSNGDTPTDGMFVAGATLSVILDTVNKKINFKSGGPAKSLVTEIIAATQEWTVPKGVKNINVRIFGAGSGAFQGYGGNGGQMDSGTFTVTPGAKYNVTIGKGSNGTKTGTSSSSGGASSFGTLLSAAGGLAATASVFGRGGAGGGGSGGDSSGYNGPNGGKGGYTGRSKTAGTNTIGQGLEFEGTGAVGADGTVSGTDGTAGNSGINTYPSNTSNRPGGGGAAGKGSAKGTGSSGGYGGKGGAGGKGANGGNGGSGGSAGASYGSCIGGGGGAGGSAGTAGDGGGGGYGGDGGKGGNAGKGGNGAGGSSNTSVSDWPYASGAGGSGGNGGNGGGGGYGAKGGDGGNGLDAGNGVAGSIEYMGQTGRKGGDGGSGGGGGYGQSGAGGNGGNGTESASMGGNGGNGGIAAGGGGAGTNYQNTYGTPGNGGDGICIITYLGYR